MVDELDSGRETDFSGTFSVVFLLAFDGLLI